MAAKAIGVWPPTVDWIAGAAPPNGTLVASSLSESLNSSAASCGVVPMPGLAMGYLPGLALIRSTSSFTVLTGSSGLTTRIFGEAAASVTGSKSLKAS